jgi:tetratricopeptide (TPR) repeat protein
MTERHARYFVDDIPEAEMERPEWVDTISDDLLAALRWGGAHDRDLQLRAVLSLQAFWARKGRWSEGRSTCDEVLAATKGVVSKARRRVLAETGRLALHQGHREEARVYYTEAAELAERSGDPNDANVVLGDLAQFALWDGDFETAEALLLRALAAAKHADDPRALPLAHAHLANVLSESGDLARAWEFGLDGVELARELEWVELEFSLTNVLGLIARRRGELAEARRILNDALDIARKIGGDDYAGYVLFCLAAVEVDDDHPDAARPYLRDAIRIAHATDAHGDLAESLELAARLLPDGAALLATADALRNRISYARAAVEVPAYEALRADLGDAEPLEVEAAVARALAALGD